MHLVITAGPTREYLDSVRYLSNPSSGKMGFAVARAAARRGHRVTLVAGPVALADPAGVEVIRVTTGREMSAAAKRAFQSADAAIFVAAVCDYRPLRRATKKLPKNGDGLTIELRPTEDIAAALGRRKGDRITVAFALEDHNGREKAERKMHEKRADAVLLNGPSNIGSDRAVFEYLERGGEWTVWPALRKSQVASRIVRSVESIQLAKR